MYYNVIKLHYTCRKKVEYKKDEGNVRAAGFRLTNPLALNRIRTTKFVPELRIKIIEFKKIGKENYLVFKSLFSGNTVVHVL